MSAKPVTRDRSDSEHDARTTHTYDLSQAVAVARCKNRQLFFLHMKHEDEEV